MTALQNREMIVALGGNLPSKAGAPDATLRAAVEEISVAGATVMRKSRLFRTPCFPPGAGPDYVNAAIFIRFENAASTLLERLHDVEALFGRRRLERWGTRTLDLDLIAEGELVLPDAATQARWRKLSPEAQRVEAPKQLILPHPRLQDRAFVLVPMADVAPNWRHPVLGLTVRQMLDRLPEADRAAVVPIGPM